MTRRARLIAGTFALVAMTSALAESVVASMCAPGMDMGPAAAAMADRATAAGAGMPGMPDTPGGDEQKDGPPGDRDCPFGPVTTVQGCAGAASLPGQPVAVAGPSPEGASGITFDRPAHDLLLGTALFHPPRA